MTIKNKKEKKIILSEDLMRFQGKVSVQELIVAFLAAYPHREQIKPTYPNVDVELVGKNGFYPHIIGLCSDTMRKKGLSNETFHTFVDEASSGDYQNLLKTCAKWFSIPSIKTLTEVIYDKLEAMEAEFNETDKLVIEKTQQWLDDWGNDAPPSPEEKSKTKQWIEEWIDTAPATNDEKSKVKQWLEDWVNDTPTSKESKSKTKEWLEEWCMDRSIIPSSFHKWLEDWVNNPA